MKKNKFKRNRIIIAKAMYNNNISEVFFFTNKDKEVINE